MSFKAKLIVNNKHFNILKCEYSLYQETDATGRPSSVVRGGKIFVMVESTAETFFSDWVFNSFEKKSGSIQFKSRKDNSTLKELAFRDAYMVKFSEVFFHKGKKPTKISFTISAREIFLGNSYHTNNWYL